MNTITQFIKEVAEHYNLDYENLTGNSRKTEYIMIRMVCYAVLVENKITLENIADEFNRHHTTIMHGKNTFYDILSNDKFLQSKYKIISRIYNENIAHEEVINYKSKSKKNNPIMLTINGLELAIKQFNDEIQISIKKHK